MFYFKGEGIPAFDLVPTNPYEIEHIVVEQGNDQSPVNMKIEFKKAKMMGVHLFHAEEIM